MPSLRIGLPCIRVEENAFVRNLKSVEEVLEQRSAENIDLFVFGEANLTGLDRTDFSSRAFPDISHVVQTVNQLTKNFSTAVCVGFIEKEKNKYYLTHLLSSEGILCGIQRKVFPGNPVKPHIYSSGKEIRPISFREYQIIIFACADWMLPEPMMQAGQYEPDLIIAPTDQYHWTPHTLSVLRKVGQSVSFWLHAPLIVAFKSAANPEDEEEEVYACLAYDYRGDELIKKSKKIKENAFYTIDLELQKESRKWGGFQERKKYLESV